MLHKQQKDDKLKRTQLLVEIIYATEVKHTLSYPRHVCVWRSSEMVKMMHQIILQIDPGRTLHSFHYSTVDSWTHSLLSEHLVASYLVAEFIDKS